ncbi:unnamed protein product [Lampetra planeri]
MRLPRMLLHGGIGRAAQPSLSANCGNLRSSASSRHFARRERRAKFGRHCQLGGKRFPPNLNFRWHFFQRRGETETPLAFRSALLSLAHATYPRMEQMALDSLSLERLLSLAQEMSVSLPATKEDDLKSLKVARCIQAHFNLQQGPRVAACRGFLEDEDKPECQEPVQACTSFVRSPHGRDGAGQQRERERRSGTPPPSMWRFPVTCFKCS